MSNHESDLKIIYPVTEYYTYKKCSSDAVPVNHRYCEY